MRRIKKPLRFALALLPAAIIGGYFTGLYSLSTTAPALREATLGQLDSKGAFLAATATQAALYTLICGFCGYILADKLGLMRPFRPEGRKALRVLLASAAGGALLSLDAWTFARWIPALSGYYSAAGRFDAPTWIALILYGGIVEEVMLRLFLLSLLALAGWKLFCRRAPAPPKGVLAAANALAALLFAAGHLPSTVAMFGALTPLLVLRCFLLNGTLGLLFGRFYRKYGIQYAMLAHALAHVVSRGIWLALLP